MVRGFLSGLIWGVLLVGLALIVLSLSLPLPVMQGQGAAVVPDPAPMAVPDPKSVEQSQASVEPAMIAPTLEDAPVVQDGTAAIRPVAGTAEGSMAQPQQEDQAPDLASAGDAPMAPVASEGLGALIAEAAPSISTDPAQPIAPAEQETALAEAETDDAEETPMPEVSEEEADALLAEAMNAAMSEPTAAPEAQTDAPEPMVPAEEAVESAAPVAPVPSKFPADAPVVANAAPFLNPDNLPLMSIVLIDTGTIGAEALSSFPYPLTFAVDPLREDAVAVMQSYRDAGFEVLAISDLPGDVNPDVAGMTLPPMLDALPGVVGILEGTDTGLQGDMQLAEAVLDVVADTNYGLVLRAKGLNAAQSQATGRGLPVATVFRDFDDSGQDAAVIRRFLDQAAFKARQQGGVIMVGRVRPATISALLLWGLQDRAGSVALAPISAILTD